MFAAPFVVVALAALIVGIVGLLSADPRSWTLVLTVIAGVVLCGPFQMGIGHGRGYPTMGVAIIMLSVGPVTGDPVLDVCVWAIGVAISQTVLRRSVMHTLYLTGASTVSAIGFEAVSEAFLFLGNWHWIAYLPASIAYYGIFLLVEFIRQRTRSSADRGVSAAEVHPGRLALVAVIAAGTAMLMEYVDTMVIPWLERGNDVDRSPFVVLLAGALFYVFAQRSRSADVEARLGAVANAAIELPRQDSSALSSTLVARARSIVRADDVELRSTAPERHEIGAEVRLESGLGQYLVASRKIGGGSFTRDDESSLATLAHMASEAARVQEEVDTLEHRANTDPLTGLPNYGSFQKALVTANEYRAYHQGIALLFIDLDNFKRLNDTFGHRAGDELLRSVAERLQRSAGGGDFVSRVGGDEFVVILTGLMTVDHAKESADRIVAALSEPIELEGHTMRPLVSAGLAFSSHREIDAQSLVEDADRTMLSAKRSRRAEGSIEGSTVSVSSHRSTRLNEIVARAIQSNRLILAFQPIIDMSTDRLWAFEALTRYVDPELGPISAPSLIARAKSLGLMNELTKQVITKALDAAEQFRALAPTVDCMTVNLELGQISDSELGPFIREAAAAHPDIKLCIELNERSLRTVNDELRRDAERLQEAGVILALDDYGSDDSVVGALVHFPMDILKIDRGLIDNLKDARQREVVKALQGFGDNLGHTVIVEGIETREMADVLQGLGVRDAQGYYFGRPQPFAVTMERLRKYGITADLNAATAAS